MSVLELSRWQFGITTVYHFLFVPITIGLGFLVAGFETAWIRTGHERWLRLAKFYGKLFLINFALGLVTGIVQEFQFGMNWSAYSKLVGNIFGPPLAIEALLAFFLESTALGLWIFGWDRLPPKVHAACMWVCATGTVLSAYFILAANAWMQHPVGYTYNPKTGQDNLTSFAAVLFNPAQLAGFPHVIAGAFLVRPNPNQFSVVTPKGMRLVKLGMSESQVGEVLGKPISSSQQGSEYCVRYGTPTLKKPQFLLYDACYENGTLKRFTPKKFSAEKVER